MANIGVCIELFFTDRDYGERLRRIAELGFHRYEFWFHDKTFDGSTVTNKPKNFDLLAELNAKYDLVCTDFVLNHTDGGVIGSLVDKRDRNLVLDGLETMVELARRINCTALITAPGNKIPGLKREEGQENMIETLKLAAKVCSENGITLLVEPFNSKVDHPNCFLDDPATCVSVLKEVASDHIKMLYDIYHMQIMAGDIVSFVRANIGYIGHFHVAGVPGRHEPVHGELNYPYILKEIDALGYRGAVGLEYWPTIDHAHSLESTREWLSEGSSE